MAKRVAVVVPRCGQSVYGGAEKYALQIAKDLSHRYEVEILTTCAEDYWSWENALPRGVSELEGIPVRRFAVDEPRDVEHFNRLSRSFRYRIATLRVDEQESWIRAQGPYSSEFLQYLFQHRSEYDLFVFMPYLYATTYFGLPIVRERAVLFPLAHDEWPLYLPAWENTFGSARELLFATPEERDIVRRRFRSAPWGQIVHPAIVHPRPTPSAALTVPGAPFMLYLGRMDESKGVSDLLQYFKSYTRSFPGNTWQLAFAGPAPNNGVDAPGVSYLGPVDEAMKWALLNACDLFVMPSFYESLSIATIEAWSMGRAALVNGRNPVLVEQVRRAEGGLWYYDQASFDAALGMLSPPLRSALGKQGRKYVNATYSKGDVIQIFDRILERP